ncbi:MAG TPA: hypothetical protein VGS12_01370 [Caulobacteraceae bacterium]|nr:hypothetical protein [Caulobacteraceae bacterium]
MVEPRLCAREQDQTRRAIDSLRAHVRMNQEMIRQSRAAIEESAAALLAAGVANRPLSPSAGAARKTDA